MGVPPGYLGQLKESEIDVYDDPEDMSYLLVYKKRTTIAVSWDEIEKLFKLTRKDNGTSN